MSLLIVHCPSGNLPCKFCGKEDRIQMYVSECSNCNTRYMSVNQTFEDFQHHLWTLVMITFNLDSPIYCSLVMDLRKQETTVWFEPRGSNMKKIVIPKVFPDTLPSEALTLAKRLHDLIVFS